MIVTNKKPYTPSHIDWLMSIGHLVKLVGLEIEQFHW